MTNVGRVFTNDFVFCASAEKQQLSLQHSGQDAVVAAIAKSLPAKDAIVYGAGGVDDNDNTIDFEIEYGPRALEAAMRDTGLDAPMSGSAVLPTKPGAEPVRVIVTPN
jgi:hypothetical protein